MTFKTPNLIQQATYRDKNPPPQDWSAYVTDPLILLQLYDMIQATPTDVSSIRSFLASESLPSLPPPPKRPPCNDPVLFQSLDKVVTKRRWLPTMRSSKAIHSPVIISSRWHLSKLGSRVPTPTRPPKRGYVQGSLYPEQLRKYFSTQQASAGSHPASATDVGLDIYTDGSGTQARCSSITPAGWGFAAVEAGQVSAEAYGPVITSTDSAIFFGATVGSNNTGELQAWMESASYLLSCPHL